MAWLKRKSQSSKTKKLYKELREEIYKGANKRLIWMQNKPSVGFDMPNSDDLLVLSLLSQDLANAMLNRLTRALIFLTTVLVLVAGADIALRIFN